MASTDTGTSHDYDQQQLSELTSAAVLSILQYMMFSLSVQEN